MAYGNHNSSGQGVLATIGCLFLLGKLAFWGLVLYVLYQLAFNVIPSMVG